MKHTPGPWHVGVKQAEQIVYDSKGWAVANATVYHGKSDIPETKANARLIAAAPEMYEALRFCEVELAPDGDKGNIELWQKVRAILAKIDGN